MNDERDAVTRVISGMIWVFFLLPILIMYAWNWSTQITHYATMNYWVALAITVIVQYVIVQSKKGQ